MPQREAMMIAVEGVDKVGKTTQIEKILNYLHTRNIPVETFKFPQYQSEWGQEITKYLNGDYGDVMKLPPKWVMLVYAMDRMNAQSILNRWLSAGKWIILDRYTYSNAFSIAKHKPEQWAEKIKYLENLEFEQMRLIKPDYNLYLHADPDVGYGMRNTALKDYQRGSADKHESNLELLTNTAAVYKQIAATNPAKWGIVDEMKPDGGRFDIEEVFGLIRPHIDKLITASIRKK